MTDTNGELDAKPDSFDGDDQREQLLWELEVLKSRVSELEEQLRRVTAQRDAAFAALGGSGVAATADEPGDLASERWVPENSCHYCDGEGVIWVHDFRMDCKRCGGTGIARHQS